MPVQIIGQAISRLGPRIAPIVMGVVRSDKLALNYAWKGYRHKGRIVQGLRGSLIAGSLATGIVNNSAPDTPGNGIQTPWQPGLKTNKPYQTRKRSTRGYRGKCPKPHKYYRRR